MILLSGETQPQMVSTYPNAKKENRKSRKSTRIDLRT